MIGRAAAGCAGLGIAGEPARQTQHTDTEQELETSKAPEKFGAILLVFTEIDNISMSSKQQNSMDFLASRI